MLCGFQATGCAIGPLVAVFTASEAGALYKGEKGRMVF